MKKVEIDEEVYQALLKLVKSFEDTPNDVLRRLLGLDEIHKEQLETETVVKAEKDYKRPIEKMMTSLGIEKPSISKITRVRASQVRTKAIGKEYTEEYHLKGKPQEVIELFRTIDKFCRELDPTAVQRKYLAKYVRYSHSKNIFCCVRVQKSGLRVWLKLNYSDLENPPEYVRDVSDIGHWGVGDVELAINSIQRFQSVKGLIQRSFEENRLK